MEKLRLDFEGVEIDGSFDSDGDCYVHMDSGFAYLNREEVQQVIDHLTLLLKS